MTTVSAEQPNARSSPEAALPVVVLASAWDDPDAVALRAAMDAEIGPRYAERLAIRPEPAEMAVDPRDLVYVGLAYAGGRAVGHIAVRRLPGSAGVPRSDGPPADLEIKRTFVDPAARGLGVGLALLAAAEEAAAAAGARRVVLQTGDRQPEAVGLYEKAGYERIPLFAPYLGLEYSQCFARTLAARPPG